MKKILLFFFIALNLNAADFSAALMVGYNGGPGFEINGRIGQFAKDFPLQVQFGIGYTRINPGNAADARIIFINDATTGDPEKNGYIWDFSFDFLYKVRLFNLKYLFIHAGPRYAMFNGNFKFIGGNEDFDITGNHWGLGAGMISFFSMSKKAYFTLTGGLDYYFSSELTGHDTTYRPDGEHMNPRYDYEYDDADDAINQPKVQFRLMMGISFRLK